jgi:uncharacterized protein
VFTRFQENTIKRKIALITGATSGIGAEFARRLASDGYDLIMTGRRRDKIESLAAGLSQQYGIRAEVVICELSDRNQIESLADRVANESSIEVLVNNAGFGTRELFHEEDAAGHENMLFVHCLAPMRLIHAALPNMLKRGRGIIINVSSLRAFGPGRRVAVYSGTKAFLNNFSEAVHIENMGKGIKIQVLCPGFTRTDFHDRIGLETSPMNKGLVRWMSAARLVDISLRYLKKNRVICIPGFWNRMMIFVQSLMPAGLYYKIAPNNGGKRE